MFDVHFIDSYRGSSAIGSLKTGEICLDGFRETFECSVEFWNQSQYESQWLQAVKRFVEDELDSCLITSLTDPATANFLFWWLLYHDNEDCVLQNHILFFENLEVAFDISNPYSAIPQRQVVSEDGEPISEWRVAVSELQEWCKTH